MERQLDWCSCIVCSETQRFVGQQRLTKVTLIPLICQGILKRLMEDIIQT